MFHGSPPLMDTISVTFSPYLSTESNKTNEKKTLPEKLAFEKRLTKLAKYSLFAKEISFICMLSLQGHKRKKILE